MDLVKSIHKDAEVVLGFTTSFRVHCLTVALEHLGGKLPPFPKIVEIFCQGNVMNNNIDQLRMCISLE